MFVGTIGMTVRHDKKARSKSKDIKKQIIQLRAKLEADIKVKLKAAKMIVFNDADWNHPNEIVFKRNIDLKTYLTEKQMSLDRYTIYGIADNPTTFGFATAEEVAEFKNVTWPKLEAKAKRAENAKDISKIKAKIAKLQEQLEELEG